MYIITTCLCPINELSPRRCIWRKRTEEIKYTAKIRIKKNHCNPRRKTERATNSDDNRHCNTKRWGTKIKIRTFWRQRYYLRTRNVRHVVKKRRPKFFVLFFSLNWCHEIVFFPSFINIHMRVYFVVHDRRRDAYSDGLAENGIE